jgi:HK97 family phage prohead protease
MQTQRWTGPLELKRAPADTGGFAGYASVFHNVDESFWPDIIQPGAFADSLGDFLTRGFVGGIGHNWNEPVGRPLVAKEDALGLYVEARLSDTQAGRDLRTLLLDGVVQRISIGFQVLQKTFFETLAEVSSYWEQHGYQPSGEDVTRAAQGVRLVQKARLVEFSPVALPANDQAVITSVKGAGSSRYESHTERVLEILTDWAERTARLTELRGAEGREMSAEHQRKLQRVRDLLAQQERTPRAGNANAALQAHLKFLEISSRLRAGV